MKKFYIYIIILFPFILHAQQQLTLQNAIDTALRNNFDILIARNNAEIGRINNTFGVAGGLPSLNASATDNNSITNINQKLSNGIEINKNNASSNTVNAGIAASMVLFNGFKITAAKERLNSLQTLNELQLNQQIQNVMAAVMIKYFDIIRQQTYVKIMQRLLDVSQEKLKIIKERYAVGMANEADLLQVQIDLNSVEQNLKAQQLIVDEGKTDLLLLLGVKQFFPTTIHDTILIDKNIQMDSILLFLNRNPQYLSAEQQIRINEQIVKEVSAQRYPAIRLNAGYNYNYNKNAAGFNLYNQNYGPAIGATLQIPIFNGNVYKVQQNTARYNVKNAELQKESLLTSLKADALKTYQSYQNTLQQLNTQKNNYELSGKLVNLIIQKFQLNQATILDVKAAQASYENAGYLLVNLQYAAKTSEIELKRLVYRLK